MKVIRKTFQIILMILLINLMGLLAISCNLKTILVDGIIKEVVKEKITLRDYQEENFIITDDVIDQITEDEKIKELLNTKEVQELFNQYLDQTIDGLIDGEIDEIELEKDILEYLKDNKEKISSIVGEDVTEEMIEKAISQVESKDMSRILKQSIQNASAHLTETEKVVLKGYKIFTSSLFQLCLIGLILITILLIAFLQGSWYRWIKTFGYSLMISGGGIILISIVVFFFIHAMIQESSFHTKNLLNTGIGMLGSGILIVIGYSIIRGQMQKKKGRKI